MNICSMVGKIVIFLYKNLITNPGNLYPLKNPQFDSILPPPQPNIFLVFANLLNFVFEYPVCCK